MIISSLSTVPFITACCFLPSPNPAAGQYPRNLDLSAVFRGAYINAIAGHKFSRLQESEDGVVENNTEQIVCAWCPVISATPDPWVAWLLWRAHDRSEHDSHTNHEPGFHKRRPIKGPLFYNQNGTFLTASSHDAFRFVCTTRLNSIIVAHQYTSE